VVFATRRNVTQRERAGLLTELGKGAALGGGVEGSGSQVPGLARLPPAKGALTASQEQRSGKKRVYAREKFRTSSRLRRRLRSEIGRGDYLRKSGAGAGRDTAGIGRAICLLSAAVDSGIRKPCHPTSTARAAVMNASSFRVMSGPVGW
jgi:hypothetical protein